MKPPPAMQGRDLREPESLRNRNRVFVDVYDHDRDLEQRAELDSGLMARVVIDGWDKLIAGPESNELYDLKTNPDDRADISSVNPQKVRESHDMIDQWIGNTVTK